MDPKANTSWTPFKILNIGSQSSINLIDFIKHLENELGIKAIKEYENIQPGDEKIHWHVIKV
tara:strand:- start:161 stop:346 length:186 start_codon:yes stop_codon:yes gene_type:complete